MCVRDKCLSLLAVAVALLASGCGIGTCTQIGCHDGLMVILSPQKLEHPWPEGTWTIEIETETDLKTCSVVLPSGEQECSHPVISAFPGFHWSRAVEISGVELDSHPSRVDVTVFHEGKVLGEDSFELEYTRFQPNGRFCEPTCYSAQALVEF